MIKMQFLKKIKTVIYIKITVTFINFSAISILPINKRSSSTESLVHFSLINMR